MDRINYLSFKEVFLFLNTVVKPIVFRNTYLHKRSSVTSNLFCYSNIEKTYYQCRNGINRKNGILYYTIIHSNENEYMFFIREMIAYLLLSDDLTTCEREDIIDAFDNEFNKLKKKYSKNKFIIAIKKFKKLWRR